MASDQQIQTWVDQRVRPRCEATRAIVAAYDDDRAEVDDIYQTVSDPQSKWADNRTDGVPHLATGPDILAENAFEEDVRNFMKAHPSWPVILKLCVKQIGG